MRTIKFRGKVIGNNQWTYGSLIIPFRNPQKRVIEDDLSWYVYPDTVGQFTGLHDADGKEIYEGDIVMVENTLACEVNWNNSIAAYCYMRNGEMYRGVFPIHSKLIRLIGNIHDNPELLSKTKQ